MTEGGERILHAGRSTAHRARGVSGGSWLLPWPAEERLAKPPSGTGLAILEAQQQSDRTQEPICPPEDRERPLPWPDGGNLRHEWEGIPWAS